MGAREAKEQTETWIRLWRERLLEQNLRGESRPYDCRLPTISEWKAAVTEGELVQPQRFSRSVLDGPVETGASGQGAQPRIEPNGFGLLNLLGNVPELVVAEEGGSGLYLAGFPDGTIPSTSLTRDGLPH